MKHKIAGGLLISFLLSLILSFSSNADITFSYCVTWWFGTPGEYYAEYYKEGETPVIPDITPTKSDDTYLYHFIRWKEKPEPIHKDTVYHPIYKTYLKKYAMNDDTVVDEKDAQVILLHLADESFMLQRSGDFNENGITEIQDVTLLLAYIESTKEK